VISKENRLSERNVKKVLRKWKPFFSYWIVLNFIRNTEWINRFAIVIGSKSVITNVWRNLFRRLFYNTILNYTKSNKTYDFVFVIKKTNKLDHNSSSILTTFKKDILFLINKVTHER